jgi:hypothetical protein
MSARSLASALVVTALAGCGGGGSGARYPAGCDGGGPCVFACGAGVDQPPLEPAIHVAEPTMVTYQANPPASGMHWPMWQEPWGAYPNGLPRERWVHNLEHGGVVLLYHCPTGCDDVVPALTALLNATPPDRFNEVRILITPDSLMPRKVAAVAWGFRWQGDAVDANAIRCFIDARYDRAPESLP